MHFGFLFIHVKNFFFLLIIHTIQVWIYASLGFHFCTISSVMNPVSQNLCYLIS